VGAAVVEVGVVVTTAAVAMAAMEV
jgi:hypothetical protein